MPTPKSKFSGQILVKTPRTSNGRDVILDGEGKIAYKETILEAAARPVLEQQNKFKPTPLKMIITDIIPEQKKAIA